jgi:uncharacterized membrane protein YbaN (DUF454 family)
VKAAFRIASGIFLVLLGIIGLILPIMPGWIFLIPGLVILGDYFPPIKRLVEWAKRKAKFSPPAGGPQTPPQPPSQHNILDSGSTSD